MRDGMNLVAKEFIASKTDQRGVLILSERAGAARELSDALLINPTDTNQLVEALHEALLMPEDEQATRMAAMQDLVRATTCLPGRELFMNRLAYSKMKQHALATDVLDAEATDQLLGDYQAATRRLLLLDYDGTLVRFHPDPQRAQPDQELLQLLRALAANPRNRVVIISGRDRAHAAKLAGPPAPRLHCRARRVAAPGRARTGTCFSPCAPTGSSELRPVLELYVRRTAGSFIEEKDYSLVWHYRRADAELGAVRARELLNHLTFMTANTDLQVLEGNKVIEIKNAGINKGTAAARWLGTDQPDFILALGDDRTDEDTFRALPPEAYTVKVGRPPAPWPATRSPTRRSAQAAAPAN